MTACETCISFGLPQDSIRKIRVVFENHPEIEEVILYGSRALGKHHAGSDIDMTAKGESLSWQVFQAVMLELDDLMLPWKIDLSLYQQIDNPDLITHIQRAGKSFYRKQVASSV